MSLATNLEVSARETDRATATRANGTWHAITRHCCWSRRREGMLRVVSLKWHVLSTTTANVIKMNQKLSCRREISRKFLTHKKSFANLHYLYTLLLCLFLFWSWVTSDDVERTSKTTNTTWIPISGWFYLCRCNFYRAAPCKRGMCRRRVSVCLSVISQCFTKNG